MIYVLIGLAILLGIVVNTLSNAEDIEDEFLNDYINY